LTGGGGGEESWGNGRFSRRMPRTGQITSLPNQNLFLCILYISLKLEETDHHMYEIRDRRGSALGGLNLSAEGGKGEGDTRQR
jgi:hypothetical protein